MMSSKKCQCGATPRFHTVRGDRRGARRRPSRERLVCPFCGNRTSANRSRELLCEEWESAGWCGQAETGGSSLVRECDSALVGKAVELKGGEQ